MSDQAAGQLDCNEVGYDQLMGTCLCLVWWRQAVCLSDYGSMFKIHAQQVL